MSELLADIRNELETLQREAGEFFQVASTEHQQWKEAQQRRSKEEGEYYSDYLGGRLWQVLSRKSQDWGDSLRRRILVTANRAAPLLRASPLLTAADVHDLGNNAKVMAAAIRFCDYYYRDQELLHDEGTVLGIQRATQVENPVNELSEAVTNFGKGYKAVTDMIDCYPATDGDLSPRVALQESGRLPGYRPNTAFVMMWIDKGQPELSDVWEAVRGIFKGFKIAATRADEIQHEGVITERIIEEIRSSEFLFADLSGERPSVYYEVGFAHALRKRVILYRKKGNKIHFDLAGYNCPEYENLGDLKAQLRKRLEHATNQREEQL